MASGMDPGKIAESPRREAFKTTVACGMNRRRRRPRAKQVDSGAPEMAGVAPTDPLGPISYYPGECGVKRLSRTLPKINLFGFRRSLPRAEEHRSAPSGGAWTPAECECRRFPFLGRAARRNEPPKITWARSQSARVGCGRTERRPQSRAWPCRFHPACRRPAA